MCGTQVSLADNSDSGQRVCNLDAQACDPYQRSGCVDPLNCYLTGQNLTTCDCPATTVAQEGEMCSLYNDCGVGLACLGIGAASPRCVKLCQLGGTDCAAPSTCMAYGSSLGFCTLP